MASWTFLTHHARVLLCVAHDPGVRLRDIAASLNITERSAFGIITDLVEAGYVIKEKDGHRKADRGGRLTAAQLTPPGGPRSSRAGRPDPVSSGTERHGRYSLVSLV